MSYNIINKNKKEKDIILIFDGGCMRGIFGAGVATQLIKNGIYNRVHSVYATSSGSHNGAFFITKEYKKGAKIYYEDFTIEPLFLNNKLISFYKLIKKNFHKREKLNTVINLDRLENIEKTKRHLNIKKISESDINFFVKVFDSKKKDEKYLNAKRNVINKLKASSALPPFYPKKIKIGKKRYFDGGALSPAIDSMLQKIIKKYPNKKFILIYNFPIKGIGVLKKQMEDILLSLLILFYFKKFFVITKTIAKIKLNRLKEYKKFKNLYIISPDIFLSPLCDDKEQLLKLYNHGFEKTKNFNFNIK